MPGPLAAVLLAAAAVALLALLHLLFWTWWLRVPGAEDALIFTTAGDGWRIGLARRRPRGPARLPPVLLCHGLSANRFTLDAGTERYSLAAHLSRAGFDCFSLDLRGHGASRAAPPGVPRDWSFDTYLHLDVPAALDAVRAETGSDRVLWVGHSLGAVLGMAACAAYPERLAGLVGLAGPVRFGANPDLKRYVRHGFLLGGRVNRWLARMVAPFAGLTHPVASEIAIVGRNVERPVFRRLLANNIENVPRSVFLQLKGWVEVDAPRSVDGAVDYLERLALCRQPALFVSATLDGLAPPEVVKAAHDRWSGERAYWNAGRRDGFSVDYGHTDLLFGRRAPEEIFPRVEEWLRAHSAAAASGRWSG
jgi:pimeloyl-ACP methyl ester carboxylesterase